MVSDNLNKDKNIRLIKNKNTNAVKKAFKKPINKLEKD